jgi:hypothetical protein
MISSAMKNKLVIAVEIILILIIILRLHKSVRPELFPYVFKPQAGEAMALPPEVLLMKKIVDNHKINDFRSTGTLSEDAVLSQRSAEFLFPVRQDTYSVNLFVKQGEPVPHDCFFKSSSKGLDYYVCFK